MEMPVGTLCHFSKGLLLSASVLALWAPQGSWAALRIQKIPERPQKDQDVLLSVQGIPDTFQDFIWYRGEETDGGTRLFTYIPDLPRPQRDGSAMEQRDIVGFPNGSMLLRDAQPRDSGTYHVEVHINPEWTMRAKTEVQVPEKSPELPVTRLPMSTEVVAAILIGSLAAASLLVGSIAFLLVTRGRRGQRHRMVTTEKPELGPNHNTGPAEPRPCPLLPAGANPLESPRQASPGTRQDQAGAQRGQETCSAPPLAHPLHVPPAHHLALQQPGLSPGLGKADSSPPPSFTGL
ncbi:carcinoembryonic antigen-related cell adhesion molecule 19 isoform X3 [Pipistrellus kuhlii]|uniref:carcinoembryonic antigen-related cell adhesion molecule 19 isoform X3 n=1 Tax=Pipistrellus kuhlii TaxID=59472 RepID=UPI001E272CB9|nr:carcinoembryonic antigen-related cell adhesion molecule 19 isoform X3 [Pipistrellus kuhlii]